MKIEAPIIAPTTDNPTPCKGRGVFLSPHPVDHLVARQSCKGCDFKAWCVREREAAQEQFGRPSIEGTWHGELFVDGVVDKRGRRTRRISA